MRVLVAGGAGFIGSNFVRYWLAEHPRDEVVNFDALTYAGDIESLADVDRRWSSRYQFVRGDVTDASLVSSVLEAHRPDLIVNFAAESHNSRAVIDPSIFTRTNVVGTQTLLEASRVAKVARFHQISTCEVYGDLPLESDEAFTEESPRRPRTPYSASKAAADLIARAYHETYGMFVTISTCSNNYGPWQHPEKVIALFTTNALEDRPLPLYRHSNYRREWLHVEDHCRALEAILLRGVPGKTYNIGTGSEHSVEEIATSVLTILGKPEALKTYVEDRPGHDRRFLLDHTKITRELGWIPIIGFAEGLRDTIEWYRTHQVWWRMKKLELRQVNEFGWSESEPPASRRDGSGRKDSQLIEGKIRGTP